MASHRVSRLNQQLRREISDIVRNELRDPRVGTVTITDVRVTPDLEHARVFVSTGGEHEDETLTGLRAAASYIRGELGRRLHIRHTPELRFEVDASLAHARRIEELLRTVRTESSATEDEEADEATEGQDREDDHVA